MMRSSSPTRRTIRGGGGGVGGVMGGAHGARATYCAPGVCRFVGMLSRVSPSSNETERVYESLHVRYTTPIFQLSRLFGDA